MQFNLGFGFCITLLQGFGLGRSFGLFGLGFRRQLGLQISLQRLMAQMLFFQLLLDLVQLLISLLLRVLQSSLFGSAVCQLQVVLHQLLCGRGCELVVCWVAIFGQQRLYTGVQFALQLLVLGVPCHQLGGQLQLHRVVQQGSCCGHHRVG